LFKRNLCALSEDSSNFVFIKTRILFEDNHVLGLKKEPGMIIQGDITSDISLLDLAKSYLKLNNGKIGQAYLGLVHRLDRRVSGCVIFAKSSKSASRICKSFY